MKIVQISASLSGAFSLHDTKSLTKIRPFVSFYALHFKFPSSHYNSQNCIHWKKQLASVKGMRRILKYTKWKFYSLVTIKTDQKSGNDLNSFCVQLSCCSKCYKTECHRTSTQLSSHNGHNHNQCCMKMKQNWALVKCYYY